MFFLGKQYFEMFLELEMAVKCPLQSHTAPSDLGHLWNALCLPLSGWLLAQQKRCSSTSLTKQAPSSEEVYFEMVIAVWSFPEKGRIKPCGEVWTKAIETIIWLLRTRANQVVLSAQPPSSKKLGILQTITGMANVSKKVMKFDWPVFWKPSFRACAGTVFRGACTHRIHGKYLPTFTIEMDHQM